MKVSIEEMLAEPPTGSADDAARFVVAADAFLSDDDLPAAAAALDRAYALAPDDPAIARQRLAILDQLSLHEHGLTLRFVPAGAFLMGSLSGEPDERPVHRRPVQAFWITDVPITWQAFCALLGWELPPDSAPPPGDPDLAREDEGLGKGFFLNEMNKIRMQYCESDELAARDWHAHAGMEDLFGTPPGRNPAAPRRYDRKPTVAVAPADAEELAARLSTREATYRLPTEAEWEKAARGGLSGKRYPWGDAPPTRAVCDFDRFGDFRLADPRALPPNGYGLFGMSGGVWEWTRDRYDALAYHRFAKSDERAPAEHEATAHVIRGGSWCDSAAAVTVSFRGSRAQPSWRHAETLGGRGGAATPNVGFRLVRQVTRGT